jgi:hypothetical protein
MANRITNERLAELMDAKLTGLKAEIKASTDMTTYKLDELITYQKVQNGRLSCLEDETRVFRLIHRNSRTSIAIIIILIVGFITMMPFILKAIF